MRKRNVPDIHGSRRDEWLFGVKAAPEHGISTINAIRGFLAKVATEHEGGM
jgi:hypothetical protein